MSRSKVFQDLPHLTNEELEEQKRDPLHGRLIRAIAELSAAVALMDESGYDVGLMNLSTGGTVLLNDPDDTSLQVSRREDA